MAGWSYWSQGFADYAGGANGLPWSQGLVTRITDGMAASPQNGCRGGRPNSMFHPSLLYLLAAFYAVFGVLVIRRLRQVSCRICLFRQGCPNRRGSSPGRGGTPCHQAAANLSLLQESNPPETARERR
jgi:hypothetical protein